MKPRSLALFAFMALLLSSAGAQANESWFGSLDQATGEWVGYRYTNNYTQGQGFYNLTDAPVAGSILNITECGLGLKSIDGTGLTDLSVAVYAADPSDPEKWVYPSLAYGSAGAIGGVGGGWVNISMTTTNSIYSDGHYYLVFYEGGALDGGLQLKLTYANGGGDRITTSNGTYSHSDTYNVSSFISYDYIIPINITITTPANTTYNGTELTANASFASNSTANCTRYLNGAIWNSTIETNSIPFSDQLTGFSTGNNNYTVNCTNETNGQTDQDTVYFTIIDTFSFRAYDNITSTQLQNFTVTFENTTNTTAYTATGEWLNVSRHGLPFGDINLTIQIDGYEGTTFARNVNNTDIIYENYAISPAGFNIFVFDEETEDRIWFSATISNATGDTITYTTVPNVTEYYLNSSFPTGVCTVDISTANNSHYERRYYATITNESYYWLNAYLLNQSTDAILTRFHIQNAIGSPIETATMNILTNIAGNSIVVGQGITDASGTVLFYLKLNAAYDLQVTHPDYQPFFSTISATNTDYYITLADTQEEENPYLPAFVLEDIAYALTPSPRIIENELTNISFYVSSANGTIQYFGMEVLWNGTAEFIENVTGSPNGGIISYVFNNTNGTTKTADLLEVRAWIKRNPEALLWFSDWVDSILNVNLASLHDSISMLSHTDSDKATFVIALFLIALFTGAWVARRNRNAGLITIVVILGIGTGLGVLDISSPWNNNNLLVGGAMIGVTAIVAWFTRDR